MKEYFFQLSPLLLKKTPVVLAPKQDKSWIIFRGTVCIIGL